MPTPNNDQLAAELKDDLLSNRSPAVGTLSKVIDALYRGAAAEQREATHKEQLKRIRKLIKPLRDSGAVHQDWAWALEDLLALAADTEKS